MYVCLCVCNLIIVSDPCNDPNACKIPHAVSTQCDTVADPNKELNIVPHMRHTWSRLFQKKAKCSCEPGYSYDEKTHSCVDSKIKLKTPSYVKSQLKTHSCVNG